jgi:hypothetical protein
MYLGSPAGRIFEPASSPAETFVTNFTACANAGRWDVTSVNIVVTTAATRPRRMRVRRRIGRFGLPKSTPTCVLPAES